MWYLICSYVGSSSCGLVSLTSSYPSPCSPYSSEFIGGGFFLSAEICQNLKMAAIGRNMM